MKTHRKSIGILLGVLTLSTVAAVEMRAQTTTNTNVLTDNFDSYNAGPLIGQGGWKITGNSTVNPLTVTKSGADGYVPLANNGQDAYEAFTTAVAHTDGNSLSTTFSLNLSAAQTSGDYFAHLSSPAGTNNFYERIFAKATTGGYLLGISDATSTASYGTTLLTTGTAYTVNVVWNFVAGLKNDTFTINVNGTSYLNYTWTSTTADEPTTVEAFNLRQGTASAAPTISDLDNVSIDSTTTVPEPATYLAGALLVGAAGLSQRRRLRGLAGSARTRRAA